MKNLLIHGLFVGVVLIHGTSLPAQNPLENPGFDTELDPWASFSEENGIVKWNSLDANGDPGSGSLFVGNISTGIPPTGTGAGVNQNGIPMESEAFFLFTGKAFVPTGQPTTADVYMVLQFYSVLGPSCTGNLGWVSSSKLVETGEWETLKRIVKSRPGTQCVRVSLASYKDPPMVYQFDAYYDQVVLKPMLFGDGFETGDTSWWSDQMPQ